MSPTRTCDPTFAAGRRNKARGLLAAAEIVAEFLDGPDTELSDAYVTLCVHAGIAASDVICCHRLGSYATGDNHNEAIGLLERADGSLGSSAHQTSAKHLRTLLGMKTKSGYTAATASANERIRAGRAAAALVSAAESL